MSVSPTWIDAGVHPIEATQQVQQRAFAHSGRADDGDHFTALDREIEIAQHVKPLRADVIAFVEICRGEEGH